MFKYLRPPDRTIHCLKCKLLATDVRWVRLGFSCCGDSAEFLQRDELNPKAEITVLGVPCSMRFLGEEQTSDMSLTCLEHVFQSWYPKSLMNPNY